MKPFSVPSSQNKINRTTLMDFSGYYQLKNQTWSFVLIQAQCVQGTWEILIAFSVNHETTQFLKYDNMTMSFKDKTLMISEYNINLKFENSFGYYDDLVSIPFLKKFEGYI